MNHRATPGFWRLYKALPEDVQGQADEAHRLLLQNQRHPSLHFKKVKSFWSVRVGLHYRALGIEDESVVVWFWIGSHSEYDKLIG